MSKPILIGLDTATGKDHTVVVEITTQDNRIAWAKRYQAHHNRKQLPQIKNNWYAAYLSSFKKQRFLAHKH